MYIESIETTTTSDKKQKNNQNLPLLALKYTTQKPVNTLQQHAKTHNPNDDAQNNASIMQEIKTTAPNRKQFNNFYFLQTHQLIKIHLQEQKIKERGITNNQQLIKTC